MYKIKNFQHVTIVPDISQFIFSYNTYWRVEFFSTCFFLFREFVLVLFSADFFLFKKKSQSF